MSIDFAAILRDHRSLIQIRQAKACTCGWEDGFVPDATEAHTAHLAAVLQAAVREALASEATRTAVTLALLAEGAGPGSSLHSWRCEYPDRYGPCDCVGETASEVLAAVAALVGVEQ